MILVVGACRLGVLLGYEESAHDFEHKVATPVADVSFIQKTLKLWV